MNEPVRSIDADVTGRALRDCPIKWDAQRLEQHLADCQARHARVDINDFPYVVDGQERFLNIVLTPVTTSNSGLSPRSLHPTSKPAPNAPSSPPPEIARKYRVAVTPRARLRR